MDTFDLDNGEPDAKRARVEPATGPTNPLVCPLLTDLYQLTMSYAYWRSGRHEQHAVFDLFFRKNPFRGEFTVFAGISEVLKFVETFSVSASDIEYLKGEGTFEHCDPKFFDWLESVDMKNVKIYAMEEGRLCFPRVPLMRIEGPLATVQLLETTLLCLVNYPSLIMTNAARFRLAAGPNKRMLEFGLRRAQGPDGGVSASKYAYIGGFDATSHVLAGKLFGVKIEGTHAHSFITSFTSLRDIRDGSLISASGETVDFKALCISCREEMAAHNPAYLHTNESELAAFIDFAQAYPRGFCALIDTYDVLYSGLLNFIAVALALFRVGFKPLGVRLDSGDLAYLSTQVRDSFKQVEQKIQEEYPFANLTIMASNDINENVLHSLNHQGHEIDCYGIGTHLVTCQAQPALGCVFKLVEIQQQPRIKLSAEQGKTTLPGKKVAWRLYDKQGKTVLDYLTRDNEAPQRGQQVLCRHPFEAMRRVYVTPDRVEALHKLVWDGERVAPNESVDQARERLKTDFASFREDHQRNLNPTPYKVSVSDTLYSFIHRLMESEAPIKEIE